MKTYKIKIFPVKESSIKAGHYPKYSFHISEFEKKKFQRFVIQEEDLIDKINQMLKQINFDILSDGETFEVSRLTISAHKNKEIKPNPPEDDGGLFDKHPQRAKS